MLSKNELKEIGNYIKREARPLEKALYNNHFEEPCPDNIIRELAKYQNADGGFGNGLEPDFLLADSSPMASSVALQHLILIDDHPKAKQMIKECIHYLEDRFIPERKGWYSVPVTVNDYPHTPWWEYNKRQGMTVIDKNWGNPSAELIGYLYRYRDLTSQLDPETLLDYAIQYLNSISDFESFHEIFCFIRLYNSLPAILQARMEDKIKTAISLLLSRDRREWDNSYLARPLDFVNSPEHCFAISQDLIKENLDYFVDKLVRHGMILPHWKQSYYNNGLEKSWDYWIGILTLRALLKLDNFDYLERLK